MVSVTENGSRRPLRTRLCTMPALVKVRPLNGLSIMLSNINLLDIIPSVKPLKINRPLLCQTIQYTHGLLRIITRGPTAEGGNPEPEPKILDDRLGPAIP